MNSTAGTTQPFVTWRTENLQDQFLLNLFPPDGHTDKTYTHRERKVGCMQSPVKANPQCIHILFATAHTGRFSRRSRSFPTCSLEEWARNDPKPLKKRLHLSKVHSRVLHSYAMLSLKKNGRKKSRLHFLQIKWQNFRRIRPWGRLGNEFFGGYAWVHSVDMCRNYK